MRRLAKVTRSIDHMASLLDVKSTSQFLYHLLVIICEITHG